MAKAKVKSVEDKLLQLYKLQMIDSRIDQISVLKGELPMEVQDLEDEIAGIEKRIEKLSAAISEVDISIGQYHANIKEAEMLIERYEKQLEDVKNNREFDALTKEIELQKLEIQLSQKKIGDKEKIKEVKREALDGSTEKYEQKKGDLSLKKVELEEIIEKTNNEESKLMSDSESAQKGVEERLLKSYKRIRNGYRNGLSVVTVKREACGGCFNRIPPQRQIEIGMIKNIIACEHCGRVLIDDTIAAKVEKSFKKKS